MYINFYFLPVKLNRLPARFAKKVLVGLLVLDSMKDTRSTTSASSIILSSS